MSVLGAGVPRSYVLGSDVPGPHIHWLLVFLNSMYGVYGVSDSSLHWVLVSVVQCVLDSGIPRFYLLLGAGVHALDFFKKKWS